ncbi:ATP-binding cassette domain-containing protein [bacterium]|jgi:cell division transport system ATP-binding protein|nr:ATP-binding cassette domain-containing protein [bacterium]
MLQLDSVSKWFDGQNRVLDQISLRIKQGEFLYVTGGTGAGKTTLLRLLATEEPPSYGGVSLFGFPMSSVSQAQLRAIRLAIGYVPQSIRLIPDLTVQENVALSLSIKNGGISRFYSAGAQSRQKIQEVLERLGLAQNKNKIARHLSGGEAQRVAIARALVRSPELILADEPTGAQDKDSTWQVMDLFVKANLGGATVIVATHDREIVRRVRKRCAILKGGRLEIQQGLGEMTCFY